MLKTYDAAYKSLSKYESDFFMSIMLAQWAIESDYGKSELATEANNYTGHKTTGWTGAVYPKDTIEDDGKGNKYVAKQELFRKYASPDEWAKAHASWLQRLPETYAKAVSAKTVDEQAGALQGTYATDTDYKVKLLKKIKEDGLLKYDTKKESGKMPKVLLIAGHGLNKKNGYFDPGAQGYVPKGEHRWYAEDVFPAMKKYLPANADIVFHTAYNVYSQQNLVSLAKLYGSDTIVIECHFDSGGTAYSKPGGHVIISSSFNPDALDLSLRDAIKSTVGLHPSYANGISKRNNLQNVNMAANGGVNYRLIEWGMSSDKSNGDYMVKNVDTIAKAFVKAIYGEVKEPSGNTPTPPKNDISNDFDLPAYKEPTKDFKGFKEGDIVTIRKPHEAWYIPATKQGRKPSKDYTGQKFKVTRVMDVKVGYSRKVYLLDGVVSWLLEQDVVEARADWDSETKDQQERLDYVYIDGVKRAIGDVIK